MAAKGATPNSYGFVHLHHISEYKRLHNTKHTVRHKYMTFFIDYTVYIYFIIIIIFYLFFLSVLFSAILKHLGPYTPPPPRSFYFPKINFHLML